jgi:hypothetical protein
MTPKEKAEQLVESFIPFSLNEATTEDGFYYSESIQLWNAKQCALVAVDEIIKSNYKNTLNDLGYRFTMNDLDCYWEEVKQEIEKL